MHIEKSYSDTQSSICFPWKHGLLNIKFALFMQNEEVLKKCAQDYLARVKQEEQRYQTLKMHAEEKLDKYEAEQKTFID